MDTSCNIRVLRGMQDVKIPTLIAFISYCNWFSALLLFRIIHSLKSTGIWIGLLVGLASASLLYLRFNYLTKKLISK